MATINTTSLGWTTVCVDSTSEVAFPASGWMSAKDINKYRGSFEARAFSGLMNVALGYQTANVENSPDAHNTVTSFQTTAAMVYGSAFTDISANTLGKQLVRAVWVCKLTSGSTLATVRVAGSVDWMSP